MGLVLTLGFLMLVSLVISAGLAAFGHWVEGVFPGAKALMAVVNFVITLALLSAVFAAIYKFLPDKPIAWRDVAVGAVATALLFTIGKSLIGLYIGSSNVAESYGTAGSLIIILLWIYYSTVTFLAGAEFTRAYAQRFGSHAAQPEAETAPRESETARTPARLPEPAPEPRPAAAMSPDLLERDAASTRAQMNQTWRVIRERIPEPPALPAKAADGSVAGRPSWLQIVVAGLAVAVLPSRRRTGRRTDSGRRSEAVPAE